VGSTPTGPTMTTYKVQATIGPIVVSEVIQVNTDLSPEDEINFAEGLALDIWSKTFSYDFDANADEITTHAIKED